MPLKPMKPCSKIGCRELTRERYCKEHKVSEHYDNRRPSRSKRGYGRQWQKARLSYLSKNPLCISCGRIANVVDHIKPHKGDMELFWRMSNWQALCSSCHSRKTAKHDGGFGN